MTWTTALRSPIPLALPQLPELLVVPELKPSSVRPLYAETTDLLVVPVLAGMRFPSSIRLLDERAGGALTRAAAGAGFGGREGESLVLPRADLGSSDAPQKHVLLLGMGAGWQFNRFTVCRTTQLILEAAQKLQAGDITMFVPSQRTTSDNVSLVTLAAIIHCRLQAFAIERGLPDLKTLKIFCTPQGARYLRKGLALEGPRCGTCTISGRPDTHKE